MFPFGNTEERARLANMGCKQRKRGFRGQSTGIRSFDHTGQARLVGYVKSQRGHYHGGR